MSSSLYRLKHKLFRLLLMMIKSMERMNDMKIYPNDLCPCGSGMKYKHCCMKKSLKQIGMLGCYPIYQLEKNAQFIVNPRGAVEFMDESKQPVLEIPEGSITKRVLSVGVRSNNTPMVTVQESDGVICYLLPKWYESWCKTCVGMAMTGMNLFPSDVEFSLNNGQYAADIL